MEMLIYQIRNLTNDKKYYGKTDDFDRRRTRHYNDLNQNQHHCIPLQKDWKELGEYNFAMEILETGLTVEEAAKFEQELIKRSYGVNYNTSKW